MAIPTSGDLCSENAWSSGCMAATRWPDKLSEPAAASIHKCCKVHDWRWRNWGQARSPPNGRRHALLDFSKQLGPLSLRLLAWLKWTGCDAGSVSEILENFSSVFLLGTFECTCSMSLPTFALCHPFSQMFRKIVWISALCTIFFYNLITFFCFFLSNVKRQCFRDLFENILISQGWYEEACWKPKKKKKNLCKLYGVHWAFVDHVKI